MPEPTKADLKAAVAKLTEENKELRDLLAAVHEAADAAPFPASYEDLDKAVMRTRSMLGAVSVITDPEGTWTWGWCNGSTAKAMRRYAAEPLGYEPDVTWSDGPVHPRDAGEGSRELSGPGRGRLREAIAEEDAAVNAAEYRDPASVTA